MAVRFIENESEYSSGYYTTNKWVDSHRLVLAKSKSFSAHETNSLVLFDVRSWQEETIVSEVESWDSYLVREGKIVYTHHNILLETDIETRETAELYRSEREEQIQSPHMTNDGEYISFYQTIEDITYFWRYGRRDRACVLICKKSFAHPFYYANHGMICPADPELMFFAHEGDTAYITNRLWTGRRDGEVKNIAPQHLDGNGELQDCCGHEMWAPDGSGLYFVKYPCSPNPEKGICFVGKDDKQVRTLYSDFRYWHVGVTEDGRYLLADTQTGGDYSEVVVIDQKNGRQVCVAKASITWIHPCHPHPQMNPAHNIVCFTGLNKEGKTSAAFVDFDGVEK